MNRRFVLLAGALLLASQSMFAQGMMSQLYCWLLGNQDVRQEYALLARQALAALGVNNSQEVAIKKMNGLGPIIARVNALSSFTAYGIWLDEAYLDTCTMQERLFHIYHEAAHYAHKHHQKMVIGITLTVPLICALSLQLNKLSLIDNAHFYTLSAVQSLIMLASAYAYILPAVVARQEKHADIAAAQALIAEGKTDVVNAYIDLLKSYAYGGSETGAWWPAVAQQIGYLEDLVR